MPDNYRNKIVSSKGVGMSQFRRSIWNELHGLTPQEVEIVKRFETDSRGTLFVAAAEILRKRGYLDEAIVVMEDGVKLFPQYHTARAALGRDYFLKGMMNEARHHIGIAVQKAADNPVAQRLKLKIDILFSDKTAVQERLSIMKQLIPDDGFTKSIRSLVAAEDWENTRSLTHAEIERLGIRWSPENAKDSTDAALERLKPTEHSSENAAWEIPQTENTQQTQIIQNTFPSENTATTGTNTTLLTNTEKTSLEKTNIDEAKLPPALRSGATLAFVRGDAERYLALKGFRRVQSEGLFSATQSEQTRRQSLDGETLAEIYAAQGLFAKAITIYERLVHSHPEVQHYKERLVILHTALKNQSSIKLASVADDHKNSNQDKAERMNTEQEKKLRLLERILSKLEMAGAP